MGGNRKVTQSSKSIIVRNIWFRVYLLSGLDGIGKHDKQKIDCEFGDNSFDLRVLGFNGKNWRLKLGPLNGLIDPAACKLKVKSNSITLELVKAKPKIWNDIKEKKQSKIEESASAGAKGAYDKDPSASLMNMMKDLYDTGDDQMKRTIAESWSKAQTEKGPPK